MATYGVCAFGEVPISVYADGRREMTVEGARKRINETLVRSFDGWVNVAGMGSVKVLQKMGQKRERRAR